MACLPGPHTNAVDIVFEKGHLAVNDLLQLLERVNNLTPDQEQLLYTPRKSLRPFMIVMATLKQVQ